MRTRAAFALLVLAATFAAGADAPPPNPPVWSRQTFEMAARPYLFPDPGIHGERTVQLHIGWVDVRTRFGRFRIFYLPLMLPAGGNPSRQWELPNAFVLTNTPIPQRPKPQDPQTSITIERNP